MTIAEIESKATEILDRITSIADEEERMKAMYDLTFDECVILNDYKTIQLLKTNGYGKWKIVYDGDNA